MSGAVKGAEIATGHGLAHGVAADLATALLRAETRGWRDIQRTRIALGQRKFDANAVAAFKREEDRAVRRIVRLMKDHPLWPWLEPFHGLRGIQTARLVSLIGDPRRFPGQRCSKGHYSPSFYAVGDCCPFVVAANRNGKTEGSSESEAARGLVEPGHPAGAATHREVEDDGGSTGCPGVMLPPRTTTGVRSVWHWAGLHAVDGRSPQKRKGVQTSWNPEARAVVLGPGGIQEEIVRFRSRAGEPVPVYHAVYSAAKARLTEERGVEIPVEFDGPRGAAEQKEATDPACESDGNGGPLLPFEVERIARKIAAKAFVGDLLIEWKRLLGEGAVKA